MEATLLCGKCHQRPHQIIDVVAMVVSDQADRGLIPYSMLDERQRELTCDRWILAEEGTLDEASGLFLCTPCYIRAGQPSGPQRWTATPAALRAIGINPPEAA